MAHCWRVDRSFALTAKAKCSARAAAQAHARGNNTLNGKGYAYKTTFSSSENISADYKHYVLTKYFRHFGALGIFTTHSE